MVPDFVSPAEQAALAALCRRKLDRTAGRVFQGRHFDGVISQFRECTAAAWAPAVRAPEEARLVAAVVARICGLFPREAAWLPPHLLELAPDGCIDYHVDSREASGSLVAVLSLDAGREVHLRPPGGVAPAIRAWVPARALYAQWGALRYGYAHAVPRLDPAAACAAWPQHAESIAASVGCARVSFIVRNAFVDGV